MTIFALTVPDWSFPPSLVYIVAAAAALGCLYLLGAAFLVERFAATSAAAAAERPSVTILKPLHGGEPGLYANLESFCLQHYAGPVQIVFGVRRASDPAAAVAQRLIAAHPGIAMELVVDGRVHGTNGKVSNLVNMADRIRHDVVILSDSDIRVGPDWLRRTVDALLQPGVAGATCLYRGMPEGGAWPTLSALNIDSHFLPNALVGIATGMAEPCFGSAIALRRETFEAIGGFSSLVDVLADDYALGSAIRATGGRIAVPALTVGHGCPEGTFGGLWHHELRWMRTIRSIDPLGHFGSLVTHPLPFALLWLALQPGLMAVGGIAAALACRIALCVRIERALGIERHAYWLIPLRDCLSFIVFLASFFGRGVRWRGEAFSVVRDGTLSHDRRPTLL